MKHPTFWTVGLGVNSMTLLLAGTLVSVGEPASPAEENTPAAVVANQQSTEDQQLQTEAVDSDAPVKPVMATKPLPPNIRPSSPVAEVIELANSGVDQTVVLAYVTNSMHTFNLDADQIIYLNDIGVPGPVVAAMIQRDEALKTMLAAAASGPGPTPAPAPPPTPAETSTGPTPPPPEQVVPAPPESGAYPAEAPLTPPSDEMFYESLAPYGNWVDVGGYGLCWQPTVVVANPGWQPYFDCGQWRYSDCGWYWLSDYSWGWAPFHYGRWFRHARLGWCWVPGQVWGPSWVTWRYSDHYCGWAPLPPGASFAVGGLNYHGHHVGEGDDLGRHPGHYRFVAWNHFHDDHLRSYALGGHEAWRAYHNSTVATRIGGDAHTVINNGLPVSRVAAATHRPVHTVALRETSRLGTGTGRTERFESSGRTLTVYRPNPRTGTREGPAEPAGASSRTVTRFVPGAATPWAAHSEANSASVAQKPNEVAPLILHGSQSAALRESAPASSLIVIGRGNKPPLTSPPIPERPSANTSAAGQSSQRGWMGTVSSSPQPAWFRGTAASGSGRSAEPAPAPRLEGWTYQATPRENSPQVPRYAPSGSYGPQRSYGAPAYSAPRWAPAYSARSAPSAPSARPEPPAMSARPAPSAPPASQGATRGSVPQQSGRNSR